MTASIDLWTWDDTVAMLPWLVACAGVLLTAWAVERLADERSAHQQTRDENRAWAQDYYTLQARIDHNRQDALAHGGAVPRTLPEARFAYEHRAPITPAPPLPAWLNEPDTSVSWIGAAIPDPTHPEPWQRTWWPAPTGAHR